jgi:Flp pilus assembly protein TadG
VAERERGSILLLLPAAVLIFLILGALSVDFAMAYSAERQLANAAAAAANDAATQSVDVDHLYATGEVRLRPERAAEVVAQSLSAKRLERFDVEVRAVEVDGNVVRVTIGGRAHYIFAKAVPGGPESVAVEASASVDALELGG